MKQKFLLKAMLLLCALVVGSSSVWAGDPETIWSEDFSSYSANDVPSGGTYSYACANGQGTSPGNTKIYNENTGGGTKPELMVGKKGTGDGAKGGTFTAVIPLDNYEGTLTLKYKQNAYGLKVTMTAGAATNNQTKNTKAEQTLTLTGVTASMTSVTIVFEATTTSNVRLDDIILTGTKASGKTPTTVTINGSPSTEVYMGDEVTSPTGATVKAGGTTVGTTVTWSSSNTDAATINASTGAITIVGPGSTTIKATFAEDATYNGSEASYELKVYGVFTTMAELQAGCAAYGNTTMKGKMTFNDVYVTAVKGNNAYISDGTNGAVIYKNGNGFAAGDKLSCSALEMDMINYSNYTPEITSLTKTTEGLTVTSGNEITPTSLAVNAITAANFGTLVKITSVTYDATNKVFKDASSNEIAYYDNFSASPTLIDGEEYDVTGIILFKNNTTVEICPRTAADVTPKVVKTNPGTKWYTDNTETSEITTITINKIDGDVQYFVSTAYTGAISYESSDESVATIANDGTISPVGYGTTTIKASTPSTDAFFASEASFTLTVKDDFVDLLLPGNVTFSGDGYSAWSNISGLWSGASYAGNTYKVSTKFQLKVDNTVGIVVNGSVGRVKKISIAWNSGTTTGRTLNIYGTNTPYTTVAVGANEVSLGSFSSDDQSITELTIDADKNYGYIRIAAAGGALYLDKIQIEWDKDVVPVTIAGSGYSTIAKDCGLDFANATPAGLEAYIVPSITASTVSLDAIDEAPASTGVILKGTASTTYSIPVKVGAAAVGTNKLQAAVTATAIDANAAYILQGGLFHLVTAASTVPAGKAYLLASDIPTPAPKLTFDFGNGNTTGISSLTPALSKVEGVVYDLQGRRVAQPTKGLYIVNGKKVVIK